MGRSETQNSTDEKFVIVGYTKKCRVQRLENFQLYLRMNLSGCFYAAAVPESAVSLS